MIQPTFAQWLILVAGLLPMIPIAIAKSGKSFNNADPRNPATFDTPLRQRARDAHYNSHEAFPFFAAAVLLATLRDAPVDSVNIAAGIWLACRLLFITFYLTDKASLRSLVWGGGMAAVIYIFVISLT